MVVTDRYKYVHNAFGIDELYDHGTDPHELHNLIDHPEYETSRRELRETLLGWMKSTGDPFFEWTAKILR